MARGQFLQHRGERVLLADYSNLSAAQAEQTLGEMAAVQQLIEREAKGSVRYLLDVTGMAFDKRVVAAFKEYGERSRPYFRASAIVGLSGLQLVVYRTVTRLVGIHMPAFGTRQEALDWLAAQA